MKNESLKDKDLWMHKLKEKLENYSESMPDSHWEQLEKELIPPVTRRITHPYRRWAMAIAAVLLVAVSSVSLYFLSTPVADEVRRANVPRLAIGPDVLPEPSEPEIKPDRLKETKSLRHVVAQVSRQEREMSEAKSCEPSVNIATERHSPKTIEEIKEVSGSEDQPQKQQENSRKEKQVAREAHRPSRSDKLHIPSHTVSKKGKWAMGAVIGNSGGATGRFVNEGASNSFPQRLNMMPAADNFVKVPENQTVYFENGLPYLLNKNEVIDIEHHQPVSVGLSVRKELRKGFSLETGLMYTLLSSDVTISGGDFSTDQKLHYLGIPVRVNWNFLDKNYFTLYVSAGGQIEKCIYGELGDERLTIKPFQFSVTGAIGAQFNATKRLGIYVEPGVAHYFDDGSDIKTIRKENSFNFNIQAGVRFTY